MSATATIQSSPSATRPPRPQLCSGVTKSGTYWISVEDRTIQVECDMDTADGGWTLVAKIASDFAWACPDKLGASCSGSISDPGLANLFDERHARDGVARSGEGGQDSGVHLDNNIVRSLFLDGRPAQLRVTFADSAWQSLNDGYVSFTHLPAELFRDDAHGQFFASTGDYALTVIKKQDGVAWSGNVLCWTGPQFSGNIRNYEGGLHFGKIPAADDWNPCHLANDVAEVQLKSHYATGGVDDVATWYQGEHSFLKANALQVPSERIAIWVRSPHPEATVLGSRERPGTSCAELLARGKKDSGLYWIRASSGRVYPVECDMVTAVCCFRMRHACARPRTHPYTPSFTRATVKMMRFTHMHMHVHAHAPPVFFLSLNCTQLPTLARSLLHPTPFILLGCLAAPNYPAHCRKR